jgi:Ca2+-binding RTX toxin-like protein
MTMKGWEMRSWKRTLVAIGATALAGLLLAATAMGAVIRGSGGPDTLNGTANHDEIYGFNGNDRIDGRGGNDHPLDGGRGEDRIIGGSGDDRIHGGADSDGYFGLGNTGCKWNWYAGFHRPPPCPLTGGPGNDVIHGDSGNDFIVGGQGADSLYGDYAGAWIYSYGDGAADLVVGIDGPSAGGTCYVDYLDVVRNCRDAFYANSEGVIGPHPANPGYPG